MADAAKNMGASVRARLLAHARKNQQTFETVLTRYALERLLYRLAQTEHGERFVLKGAMLLMTWLEIPLRATRDLDFLAFGEPSPEGMLQVFKTVLSHGVDDDGVTFDAEALTVDRIREGVSYGGLRLQTWANVGGARVRVAIDIGFGDAVEPGVEEVEYPTLLDLPAPRLRTYARETVIAEKFQAMVALGRANTRMTAAVNDCVREVARFRTGAGPTITAEEITAARGEGTQWDAVNAVAREKGGHIEKLAFARMIVDRCVEPQDGELAEAVTTYLGRMRKLFAALNGARRGAEHAASVEKLSSLIDRQQRTFVRDHPESATREEGFELLEDIARLLDTSIEAEAIRRGLTAIRRDFRLEDDLLAQIAPYDTFRDRLSGLKVSFEAERLAAEVPAQLANNPPAAEPQAEEPAPAPPVGNA